MVVSSSVDVPMHAEDEPDLDKMEWVQNLFKFKHFYDQMDFVPEQRLAITKSIIELTDPSMSCGLVEKSSRNRFDDCTILF